jgi:hypothetical protein
MWTFMLFGRASNVYKHWILVGPCYFRIWQVIQTRLVAMFHLKYQNHYMSDYLLISPSNFLIVGPTESHDATRFYGIFFEI